MRKLLIISSAFAMLGLGGCDVKEDLNNTSHPDNGSLYVDADWSNLGEGVKAPELYDMYYLDAEGKTTLYQDFRGVTEVKGLEPGRSTILLYNKAAKMSFNGVNASIFSDGLGYIVSDPGILGKSYNRIDIRADKSVSIMGRMEQAVKEIYIDFDLIPEGFGSQISKINGTITNFASNLDMITGEISTPLDVKPKFTILGDHVSIKINTIGVIEGTDQILSFNIVMNNGDEFSFEEDITTYMDGLAANMNEPLYIGADITAEFDGEAYIGAMISEWTQGSVYDLNTKKKYKVGDVYPAPSLGSPIGVVFEVENPDNSGAGYKGKIVGTSDLIFGNWGTVGEDTSLANFTADTAFEDLDGKANTDAIKNAYSSTPEWSDYVVFDWILVGYPRFYLPAAGELKALMDVKDIVNANTSSFEAVRDGQTYLSSTEQDADNAWGVDTDGTLISVAKDNVTAAAVRVATF